MQEQLQKQFQTEGHKAFLNEASVTNWKDPEKKAKDIGCKHQKQLDLMIIILQRVCVVFCLFIGFYFRLIIIFTATFF